MPPLLPVWNARRYKNSNEIYRSIEFVLKTVESLKLMQLVILLCLFLQECGSILEWEPNNFKVTSASLSKTCLFALLKLIQIIFY